MQEDDVGEPHSAGESIELTVDIVSAYVANNSVEADHLPSLIRLVHGALEKLKNGVEDRTPERPRPAVPVNKSIQNDYIICLEDGKKLKMLKRYLRSNHNMTPEDYRRKWGLPPDYPMVAPAYARRRSDFAKSIGLGKGARRDKDEPEQG